MDKKRYDSPIQLKRGDDVGLFELGSTIVLIFEAPVNFGWSIGSGEKVSVGLPLGAFSDAPFSANLEVINSLDKPAKPGEIPVHIDRRASMGGSGEVFSAIGSDLGLSIPPAHQQRAPHYARSRTSSLYSVPHSSRMRSRATSEASSWAAAEAQFSRTGSIKPSLLTQADHISLYSILRNVSNPSALVESLGLGWGHRSALAPTDTQSDGDLASIAGDRTKDFDIESMQEGAEWEDDFNISTMESVRSIGKESLASIKPRRSRANSAYAVLEGAGLSHSILGSLQEEGPEPVNESEESAGTLPLPDNIGLMSVQSRRNRFGSAMTIRTVDDFASCRSDDEEMEAILTSVEETIASKLNVHAGNDRRALREAISLGF
jgi:hypothetical protein